MAPSSGQAARLAARLRELRDREWPDAGLTQAQLSTALSKPHKVAAATLSSWESTTNPKTPPPARLAAYARFFATERSLQGTPHLLELGELTPEELARYHDLEAEFQEILHGEAQDVDESRRVPLQFTTGPEIGPVVIICPEVPEHQRGPLADEQSPNFTELHQYADIDALLQVFGHIRAVNPKVHLLHRIPATVATGELQHHLVVLGGVGWNKTTRRLLNQLNKLPIEQVTDERLATGEVFRLKKWFDPEQTTHFPVMELDEETGRDELVEDVALIARLPNPFNSARTLTVFNGIHSRGVVGAVLALTDETVRPMNEEYLHERFPQGDFAMLIKVPVLSGYAMAPDMQNPEMRILEWSPGLDE